MGGSDLQLKRFRLIFQVMLYCEVAILDMSSLRPFNPDCGDRCLYSGDLGVGIAYAPGSLYGRAAYSMIVYYDLVQKMFRTVELATGRMAWVSDASFRKDVAVSPLGEPLRSLLNVATVVKHKHGRWPDEFHWLCTKLAPDAVRHLLIWAKHQAGPPAWETAICQGKFWLQIVKSRGVINHT